MDECHLEDVQDKENQAHNGDNLVDPQPDFFVVSGVLFLHIGSICRICQRDRVMK